MGRRPTVELYVVFQVVFIVHSSKESSERSEAVNDTKQVGAERCGERITAKQVGSERCGPRITAKQVGERITERCEAAKE
jgi:hypothetical protein